MIYSHSFHTFPSVLFLQTYLAIRDPAGPAKERRPGIGLPLFERYRNGMGYKALFMPWMLRGFYSSDFDEITWF